MSLVSCAMCHDTAAVENAGHLKPEEMTHWLGGVGAKARGSLRLCSLLTSCVSGTDSFL